MPIEEKKKKVEQCICHSILCAFSQKVQAWDKKGNKKNLKKKEKKRCFLGCSVSKRMSYVSTFSICKMF